MMEVMQFPVYKTKYLSPVLQATVMKRKFRIRRCCLLLRFQIHQLLSSNFLPPCTDRWTSSLPQMHKIFYLALTSVLMKFFLNKYWHKPLKGVCNKETRLILIYPDWCQARQLTFPNILWKMKSSLSLLLYSAREDEPSSSLVFGHGYQGGYQVFFKES